MLNYSFIDQKAKESQIDNITIEREYWQLLFLQRLYLSKGSEHLFFKGGTAIRFLFGSFRFSEDLDFTSSLSYQEVDKLVSEVFSFLKKNTTYSLELKREKVSQNFKDISLRFRFLFTPQNSTQKVSIRIDISLREKAVSQKQSVLIPFDYPISPYPLVVHLGKEEILAEKIRALFVRKKPRDLFDLWFLLSKNIKIVNTLIEKKFSLYPSLRFNQEKLRQLILEFDNAEMKRDLNQFLPQSYRNFYQQLPEDLIKLIT